MDSWQPGGIGPWQWLEIVEHELLLFAAVVFLLGALDELAIDLAWLRLKLRGKTRPQAYVPTANARLGGIAAVLVPAWREAEVVSAMLRHCLAVWPQAELRVYAGCYRNDPATLAAMVDGSANDPRIRVVVVGADGPTSKADCLNRLYAALEADERRTGIRVRSVILHDAEDLVHRDGLALIDATLANAEFVQLPVVPVPQAGSRWIAGHYGDEFAEAHGKTLVVRDALGAGLPAAGVGCGFDREMLARLARRRGDPAPFAAECLTEDYELGLRIAEAGGRQHFVRALDRDGAIVATRELFPGDLGIAVRQKTRWLHGIAFQGWDRLGWSGSPAERWMRLRDRRGPLTALTLAMAYATIIAWGALRVAEYLEWHEPAGLSPVLVALLWINLAAFAWRAGFRFAFTTATYGWREGMYTLPRIFVANIIAIMAGRRATVAYLRSLLGGSVEWEKTPHRVGAVELAAARLAR